MCGVCVSYSPPPLIFIAGSHGVKLAEPPSAASEEMTCGEVEAVGPMGQVGQPSRSCFGVGSCITFGPSKTESTL